MTTIHAGTVISGTHRCEDLVPAFLDALRGISREVYNDFVCDHAVAMAEYRDETIPMDGLQCLTDYLFEALDELAPEGMYFGALEGDGADFGFWKVIRE